MMLKLLLFIFVFLLCEWYLPLPTCMHLVGLISVLRYQGTFLDFTGIFCLVFSPPRLAPVVLEYLFDAEVSVFICLRSYISVHLHLGAR